MNKEMYDLHRNWVVAVMNWAKSKTPQWLEEGKYLDQETFPQLLAALPKEVVDGGIITLEQNGTVAYLRYAPHVMGCVAFNVTFCAYQRTHSRYHERLYRIWGMDGPVMLANLDKFYPWHHTA